MALSLNYKDSTRNVEFLNCYWRITDIEEGDTCKITVNIYFSREKSDLDKISKRYGQFALGSQTFYFVPNRNVKKVNLVKQAYRYLKTLPMFEKAVNV